MTQTMMVDRRRLVGPVLALAFAAAMAMPVVYLLYRSVGGDEGFTLSGFDGLVTGYYMKDVLLMTLGMAGSASLSAAILAYPVAFVIAHSQFSIVRAVLAVAVLLPLWTNIVVRVFGWQIIFSADWPIWSPQLLATSTGVYVALTITSIPYIVLPLVSSFESIPRSLEESAAMAGAGPWRSLFRITVPLTLPGVAAGLVLAFALNLSSFAIPAILGGGKIRMAGLVIYEKMSVGSFQSAAALGVVMLVLTGVLLLPLLFIHRLRSRLARRAA